MSGFRTSQFRIIVGALALSIFACGGSKTASTTNATENGVTPEQQVGAAKKRSGPKVARSIIQTSGAPHTNNTMLQTPAAAPTRPDARKLYKELGPATVIVRTPNGMGSGVMIGPDVVLTNNHVIRPGENVDFKTKVDIEFGSINRLGSMQGDGQRREGWVIKTDVSRDLALVRVKSPPKNHPIVKVAAGNPEAGTPVSCLGHGNVGLLWAIRTCEIEASGRLEDSYAQLDVLCNADNPMAHRMCEQLRNTMNSQMNGTIVQSSCVIAPGDSGGPLVNAAGELVGLNVLSLSNRRMQRSNIHIHAEELRDFVATIPDKTEIKLPTPWLVDAADTKPDDADLDGRWDAMILRGPHMTMSRIFDLDQNTQDFSVSDAGSIVEDGKFDAEAAIVSSLDRNYFWYDSNDDGKLDTFLKVRFGDRVEQAYRITANGTAEKITDPVPGKALNSKRIPAGYRARFDAIFHNHHELSSEHPSPMPALLRSGHLADSDRDGKKDTILADRGLAHVMVLDLDQDSTATLTNETLEQAVRAGKIDAEVSMIRRGGHTWVFYDRNNDGKMDLGVRTGRRSAIIEEVLTMDGAPPVDAAQFLGTLAIRDMGMSEAKRLSKMLMFHAPASWMARESEHAGLPHPKSHHVHPRVADRKLKRWENAIVMLDSRDFHSTLIDVDKSTFKGRKGKKLLKEEGLVKTVNADKFSAEFGYSNLHGVEWSWYDTNKDGTFDVVLVSMPRAKVKQAAFRRNDKGEFEPAPDLVEGKIIRPSLLPRRMRKAFTKLVKELYKPEAIED